MTARQARKARRAAEREARKLAEKQQPISEARLAANRTNARLDEPAVLSEAKTQERCSGPKSEEGKTRSSRNSFKHGLYSKQLVLPGEDPAALDELKADLRAEHQPTNETEEILVNEMAEQYWRLRRARRLEAESLSTEEVVLSHLAAIQRMMSSAERGFHKALTALRQLQKDRGSRSEPASALGFVPQNQNRDSEAVAELTADGSSLTADSYSLTAPSGFVPQNLDSQPQLTFDNLCLPKN